ncbi:MAG: serine--tRNA ligase [Armatimonadetes bacterium]|nr:serine--tRNA ligase [Armatimonadota bacterium]
MLDIRLIRTDPEKVRQGFVKRGQDPAPLDALFRADERRREVLQKVEALRAERNRVSEEIGKLKKGGSDAAEMVAEMRRVGDRIKAIEDDLREVEGEFDRLMLEMPNIPDSSVPAGADEEQNVIVREWGEPRTFGFEPKPHWEIAVNLDIVDFERATKIAGANFEVFKGAGALLRRARINFMLDVHTKEHGYTEVAPPVIARRDALIASGHLPKFEEDQFHIRENDMFLIPTGESALANLHRDEILEADRLPLNYVAYTPCFRHEKFGAGKESRGLIRQFQFDKVEMFKFVQPESSMDELESLVRQAETIYQRLGIPYKLALMCAGEMSVAAAKAYDPMAWFPGTGKWMELSSCSNCLDWQARRANVRFRREQGAKPEFVHTLNGSGLAVGRTFAAILENYQQDDDSVVVPEVLRGYMGGLELIGRDL